jgi:uncharacterized protein YeeX (DUF496 family)
MSKIRKDWDLSDAPLTFKQGSGTVHWIEIEDKTQNPNCDPNARCCIAQYHVASPNAFIGLGQIRNEMQREVKGLQVEIEDRQKSIATLRRVIGELEAAMDLESRSKEIAKAVSEAPDCDRPAVIANLLKKQELELSK